MPKDRGINSAVADQWQNALEQGRQQREEAAKPWRERLTGEQRDLVDFSQLFSGYFKSRERILSADSRRLVLIAKLAELLDERPEVFSFSGWQGFWPPRGLAEWCRESDDE